MCRCQCPARISAPWTMIRSRITFTASKAGVTASSVLWQIAQSFLGESVSVNDTGDSEKPRNIAVHSMKRLLFWTDVGNHQAIIRARVDGNERLEANKLEGVTALALDQQSDMIYYAQASESM
ncbi:pro-epidermal growth factor-like [Drosophila miranda]|uniref:pro-epidermal growth factor-like n=1 Tax=Drosophila miranda TaxID=7229 RepID=UPI00143F12C3|nr:pro-epidermal growth factor-like [Drosophila miranda]